MYAMRFDGLYRSFQAEGNPNASAGLLCYGWLIYRKEDVIAQGHGVFARCQGASSNVAEYVALIEGLDALGDLGLQDETIKVFGDAKSVIDQMNGVASVSSEAIWPLYMRARQLGRRFIDVRWIWTPRKNNKAADLLTRRAMRQIRYDPHCYQAVLKAATDVARRRRRSTRLLPLIDLRIFQPTSSSRQATGMPNFIPGF